MDLIIIVSYGIVSLLSGCLLSSLISDIKFIINDWNWVATVSDDKLIQEIVLFSNDILHQNRIKHFPSVEISYYKHPSHLGAFCDPTIVIYPKNNPTIRILVNTTLHEVNHYIQSKTNLKEFKKYDEYIKRTGYDKNPLEIQCRIFAKKWTAPCISHLKSKGIIKRAWLA